jgi:hypothetical protein
LARTQEIRRNPAVYQVDLRQEGACSEANLLILAYLAFCDFHNTPKLTLDLPKVGVWIGMLLFSVSFYYGLARVVICGPPHRFDERFAKLNTA